MLRIGYRAVEEQHQPSTLLTHAVEAEKWGFDFIGISDHFHPWFHKGGNAGHAWVWIAAAASKTKGIQIGTCVTTPTFRYHPAVTAQAFATLDEMFPGRVFLGVGTGEAMNEIALGFNWPSYSERYDRLVEAIEIIKALWKGGFVTFKGKYFCVVNAKLYTPSKKPIPLYISAEGRKAAYLAGKVATGFMTYDIRVPGYFKKVLSALREGCESIDRSYELMPKMMEMKVSYDESYDRALRSMLLWRVLGVDRSRHDPYSLADPRELDKLAAQVPIETIENKDYVYTSMEDLIRKIEFYVKLGFNEIQVGSSSPDELKFIGEIGKKVIPYLKEAYT